MDFALTETDRLVQQTAREFARTKLSPRARELDEHGDFPADALSELARLGLMGVNVPSVWGGAEAGAVAYALAMIEIARGCAATAVTMAVTNMVAEIITRFGDDAQREQHVPRLTSGEYLAGSFALSEPGAGSDPGSMQTTATATDHGFVLNGHKAWVTSGAYAGVIVVWARTGDPNTLPGSKGISCFLVRAGSAGLHVGPAERKMGLRGSNTVPLVFDGCEVRREDLLGELHRGFPIAMTALDGGRIGIAAQAIGIATAALDAAVHYAQERRQFGRPIADFQAVQVMIADSRNDLDAATLLCFRAAWRKAHGHVHTREAAMAKLYASEAAQRICDRALQIHGANGYMQDFPLERHVRDVRATRIYEGTSEMQRMVIARSVLLA